MSSVTAQAAGLHGKSSMPIIKTPTRGTSAMRHKRLHTCAKAAQVRTGYLVQRGSADEDESQILPLLFNRYPPAVTSRQAATGGLSCCVTDLGSVDFTRAGL